jgi:hypothetical protein
MAALDSDEVPVLVADLRMIARAINGAYGAQAAWDLLNQYRGLESAPKQSNLSKALTSAHKRVLGYIAEAEEEEPIEEPEDDPGV